MQRKTSSRSSENSAQAENQPLILSPHIEAGHTLMCVSKAHSLPLVKQMHLASYSGFFTVNKNLDSNLFFWFFESQQNPIADPLIVHLRGGLGTSILKSIFEDSGPYIVEEDGVKERENSWNRTFNVLYIDSPIGAGFSFTKHKDGYSKTDFEVAENLYSALIQFLKMFHHFQKNRLYLSAESYSTKHAMLLALLISERSEFRQIMVNLKGLFLGSPIIDPINQLKYAEFLKTSDVLNDKKYKSMLRREKAAARAIASNQTKTMYYHLGLMYAKMFKIGYYKLWDVRFPKYNDGPKHWSKFVQSDQVRKAIHVGDQKFSNRIKAAINMRQDISRSMIEFLPTMLERYKVVIYAGQFDMLVVYDNLHDILSNVSWSESFRFGADGMEDWIVGGELAGLKRSFGNLTEIEILNANHLIVNSQPNRVYELLREFTSCLEMTFGMD